VPDDSIAGVAVTDTAAELREWLQRDPPQVPPRYFYDEHGSELFEKITHTDEYYPTRTELGLLERYAGEIIDDTDPMVVAELGSGSSRKTRLLLDALSLKGPGRRCTVFDISGDFLGKSAGALRELYPEMHVDAVVGDFTRDLGRLGSGGARRMLVFLAGTIGNLNEVESAAFLSEIAGLTGVGDSFLLGVDLVKSRGVLEAAYDDAQGFTAAFNINMLRVLNEEFGANFDLSDWRHRATWNEDSARVEIWLDAVKDVDVYVKAAGFHMHLKEGEGIRTEISCKYTSESLRARLAVAGLRLDRWMTDPEDLFALALIRKEGA